MTVARACVMTLLAGLACGVVAAQTLERAGSVGGADATLRDFERALAEYDALRKKVDSALPALPRNASPQQIEANQRSSAQQIGRARAGARPGTLFVPSVQPYFRNQLMAAFKRPDGPAVRETILDENPIGTPVRINGPYPDAIPLATMPPQLLEALPKLPPDIEYRFVGDRLILFDNHAHIVIDYLDKALPEV